MSVRKSNLTCSSAPEVRGHSGAWMVGLCQWSLDRWRRSLAALGDPAGNLVSDASSTLAASTIVITRVIACNHCYETLREFVHLAPHNYSVWGFALSKVLLGLDKWW